MSDYVYLPPYADFGGYSLFPVVAVAVLIIFAMLCVGTD
jgi:hypothetical protein